MKKSTLRMAFIATLSAVLVISGGNAVKTAIAFRQEAAVYETTQETYVTIVEPSVPLAALPDTQITTPTDTPTATDDTVVIAPEVAEPEPLVIYLEPEISVDFDALTAVNSDVVAWLHISNTSISYPVLQGSDNQAYIHTTYQGNYSAAGSIFVDYRIQGDFTQPNTIIYGHNMSSGTMFGTLKSYTTSSFTQSHPYFFLLTDQGYLRYEVCYVMITSATSDVYRYSFDDQYSFADHIAYLAQWKSYDTGVSVTDDDKLVTLSTCTNVSDDQRLVVIGRLDEAALS